MPSVDALTLRIPVQNLSLIGLDFALTTLIGIAGKMKQILTCTQKTTEQSLSDYAQQDLSTVTHRSPLNMQML
jgi:hypothetical protein